MAAAGDLKFDDGSQQDSLEYFLHLLRQIEVWYFLFCKIVQIILPQVKKEFTQIATQKNIDKIDNFIRK